MTEPIEWHELGTITFRDFDDQERTLRRPKFGQIRYFQRQVREIGQELARQIDEMRCEFDQARADEDEDKVRELSERMAELNDWGVAEAFIPWYREVFKQLSDPLPDNAAEWPGYFADTTLPNRIVNHWKMRPKVSGDTTPT